MLKKSKQLVSKTLCKDTRLMKYSLKRRKESTIRTFLNIKDRESAESLVKEILIEVTYEEFDKVLAE